MKYFFVFAALFIFLSTQDSFCQKHSVGVSYEPSFLNSLDGEKVLESNPPVYRNYSSRLGHSVGIDYMYMFNKKGGVKSGLYLLDNGYTVHVKRDGVMDEAGIDRTDKIYARYISIPIEYYIQLNKFNISIGPNVNLLASSKRELGNDGGVVEGDRFQNKYAFGLRSEIGYSFAINDRIDLKLGVFSRLFMLAEGDISNGFLINMNYKLN